jgi:hypothetical protein
MWLRIPVLMGEASDPAQVLVSSVLFFDAVPRAPDSAFRAVSMVKL